jgi:hypothetical protein
MLFSTIKSWSRVRCPLNLSHTARGALIHPSGHARFVGRVLTAVASLRQQGREVLAYLAGVVPWCARWGGTREADADTFTSTHLNGYPFCYDYR